MKILLTKTREFTPPFCPNSECLNHRLFKEITPVRWWKKHGYYSDLKSEKTQRLRCKLCRSTFSKRAFSLHYHYKKADKGLSAKIFKLHLLGISNRETARTLGISECCMRNRLHKMARWAFYRHKSFLDKLPHINESIAFDGIRNFAITQHDPNEINQAVGQKSLFIYDFNFIPLNRAGYMSDRQLVKNHKIQTEVGIYPENATQLASTNLFSRLLLKVKHGKRLEIISDEHYQYKKSIHEDLKDAGIHHITISSKAHRDFQNILFPINHSDLLIRKQLAAFARETISFSKTHARMCQRFILFMVKKNYMVPQFTKKHVRRPRAHLESPAQTLGLTSKIFEFYDFFNELISPEQVTLPNEWRMIIDGRVPYPRQPIN